ncbi:MAG: zinc ribbon domain-containing protein [Methanobacteriota archaeon]|nr:MAG: zinc ribbon domain-containing protein [Euryarchaeota archaeon]
MKCNRCGRETPDDMPFCGHCGGRLTPPAVTQDAVHNRHCVACGRAMAWDAKACQYCGHDYGAKPPETKSNADELLIGGILAILAGIVSMLLLTVIIIDDADFSNAQLVLFSMVYAFAVLGVVGGLSSLSRFSFPLSVFGAACSVVGLGFFFGIPALILTARASDEFAKRE